MFKFSCICVTFGRPQLIGESVKSFLDQTYDNKELIILNTSPRQRYIFEHPQVKVINLSERPASFSEAMHQCVLLSSGDWIVPWDDDDVWMPEFLSQYADYIISDDNIEWIHTFGHFFGGIDGISEYKINSYHAHLFTIKRILYYRMGGYINDSSYADVAVDQSLSGRFDEHSGIRILNNSYDSGYIYRWMGVPDHFSATKAVPGMTHYESMGITINKKMDDGIIPVGDIHINPKYTVDWLSQAKAKFI